MWPEITKVCTKHSCIKRAGEPLPAIRDTLQLMYFAGYQVGIMVNYDKGAFSWSAEKQQQMRHVYYSAQKGANTNNGKEQPSSGGI